MRKIYFLCICMIITLLFASCRGSKIGIRSSDTKVINVDTAFKKVYKATQEALSIANSKLKLKSIDLSFTTTTSIDVNGGINLWIVSGKYSVSKANSKRTTYSFSENEHFEKSLITDSSINVFKKYLVAAIEQSQSIKDINNFGLTEMEVEVEFTLKTSNEGGFEFEILPVTASASVNRGKEAVHTITLKFEKLSKYIIK